MRIATLAAKILIISNIRIDRMKFTTFLKQVFTSHSGVSSKRLCGVVGWFVCLGVLIYCAVNVIQAPLMIDTVLWCIMGLLGIDSITSIWKKIDKPK